MARAQAREEAADVSSGGTASTPPGHEVLVTSTPARERRAASALQIRDLKLRLLLCSSTSALALLIASARLRAPAGPPVLAVQLAALALVVFAGVWCALPLFQRSLRALWSSPAQARASTRGSPARAAVSSSGARAPARASTSASRSRACAATLAGRVDPALPGVLAIVLGIALSAVSAWAGAGPERTYYPVFVVWALTSSLLASELIEQLSRRAANRARAELLQRLPEQARRLDGMGREEIVPLSALARGDLLRVRPRELVPADGVVLDGRSAVDERAVTGEPLPLDKRPGAALIGGTLNGRGNLLMRVSRAGPDSLLAAIARLTGQAEQTRARLEQEAERACAALAAGVIALTALAALVRLAAPAAFDAERLLLASCALLAVASPRALAHAVSLSFALGLTRAARAGVIVRGASGFESLAAIDTLVADKTGTLTEARPRVISVVTTEQVSEARLLSIAAGLLQGTRHPVAAAVATRAETLGLAGAAIRRRERVPGAGLLGQLHELQEHDAAEQAVAVGSSRLLEALAVRDVTLEGKAEALCDHGQTVLFVVIGQRVGGLIGVVDPIGLTTREALRELDEDGLQLVLCSSDARRTAQHLASQLGLSDVHGDKLPHEKAALVMELRSAGRRVAFASGSVDEDEARAAAQLSFQMNLERELGEPFEPTGARGAAHADGASEQVSLVRGDLAALVRALRLARLTLRTARRSMRLGFAYHALALALAVGIFQLMWDISFGPVQASMAAIGCFALLTSRALRLRSAGL